MTRSSTWICTGAVAVALCGKWGGSRGASAADKSTKHMQAVVGRQQMFDGKLALHAHSSPDRILPQEHRGHSVDDTPAQGLHLHWVFFRFLGYFVFLFIFLVSSFCPNLLIEGGWTLIVGRLYLRKGSDRLNIN